MKAFFLLSTLLLLNFRDATGQEEQVEKRLAAFINDSLPGLPTWMKAHGYVPDPLGHGTNNATGRAANLTMNTLFQQDSGSEINKTVSFLDLTGELKDRFYHGSDKNIKAFNFNLTSFEMTELKFDIDLTYGDENDYIEGKYHLNGSYVNYLPVTGSGAFTKTSPLQSPIHREQSAILWVSNEGYFELWACTGYSYRPLFTNFTLNELDAPSFEEDITKIIDAWYHTQFMLDDFPSTGFCWCEYMKEQFLQTKIVDIIGIELEPTFPPEEEIKKKLEKSPSYKQERFFDVKKKRWALKTSVTF